MVCIFSCRVSAQLDCLLWLVDLRICYALIQYVCSLEENMLFIFKNLFVNSGACWGSLSIAFMPKYYILAGNSYPKICSTDMNDTWNQAACWREVCGFFSTWTCIEWTRIETWGWAFWLRQVNSHLNNRIAKPWQPPTSPQHCGGVFGSDKHHTHIWWRWIATRRWNVRRTTQASNTYWYFPLTCHLCS